jgi:hypothetical protein
MPLMKTLARFAASPQGRRMIAKAKAYASSPEGRAKIEKARKQIASRGSSSKPKPR